MKQHKKTVALLLAVLGLGVACLGGCADKDVGSTGKTGSTTQGTTSTQGSTGDTTAAEPGDFHAELPDDFEITIMVNDWNGNPNSGDHSEEIRQMLEEHTGYKINVMWVTSDNYNDKLSTILAGGKEGLPKILFVPITNGMVISAAANGAFHPIEDYLYNSEVYPNISQADPQINQSFTINGHLYGLYMQASTVGRYGFGYRQDWADKLGIEAPKTIQDVYDLLYAFTYDDPDGNGKQDTYGLNLCSYTGPLDIMQTWFGCGNEWVEDESGQLIPVHMTEEYMEALDWFKKLYDDGLISSDWAIRDTGTWKDDNNNGIAGAFCDCTDNVRRIWDYYEQNGIPSVTDSSKTATMGMIPGIAKDENSEPKTLAAAPTYAFAITQAAESEAEVQACLEFLDKMCDDEALMLVMYGLQGIHWEYNENNEVVKIHPEDQALHKAYNGLNQLTPYIPNRTPSNYTFAQDEQTKMQESTYSASEKIAVFNPASGYLSNSATYISNGSNLDLIIDDARTQYIVGDIDKEGLQSAWELWLTSGGQDVINEVNEQHKANK